MNNPPSIIPATSSEPVPALDFDILDGGVLKWDDVTVDVYGFDYVTPKKAVLIRRRRGAYPKLWVRVCGHRDSVLVHVVAQEPLNFTHIDRYHDCGGQLCVTFETPASTGDRWPSRDAMAQWLKTVLNAVPSLHAAAYSDRGVRTADIDRIKDAFVDETYGIDDDVVETQVAMLDALS